MIRVSRERETRKGWKRMRKLDDILQETENEKMKNGVVFGKYASKITCDDLSEWENSSAGIDTNNHAQPERIRAKEEP